MKALTSLAWLLTPLILVIGLYLEVRDTPTQAISSNPPAERPKNQTQLASVEKRTQPAPVEEQVAQPTAPASASDASGYQDYWDYEEMWSDHRGDVTKLAFREWEKTQGGTKVIVEGKVKEVELLGYKNPERCMLSVSEAGVAWSGIPDSFYEIFLCEQVGHFVKGDSVTLDCEVNGRGRGLYSPNIHNCRIQ